MSAEDEATISIPSIAICAILGYFIYRYFFSDALSPSSSSSSSSSSRNASVPGQRFTPAQVEQVTQMFPQLSRRDIMWDLHRNRGSVAATTERVLGGRGLDPAPPSFQPPAIFNAPSTTTTTGSTATGTIPLAAKLEPDLITRYNLHSRINSKGKEREDQENEPVGRTSPSNAASNRAAMAASTKEQRQAMLLKRRDEMILAARRKMMEKDALKDSGGLQ